MKTIAIFAAAALLAACTTVPNVPETATVTITEYRDIPDWATKPITVQKPAKAVTGREHLVRENALDKLVDYILGIANCHRRLLIELDKGESGDPKECAKP